MFCNNCGAQIADDAKFCGSCGTPVVMQAASQVAENVQEAVQETVQEAVPETVIPDPTPVVTYAEENAAAAAGAAGAAVAGAVDFSGEVKIPEAPKAPAFEEPVYQEPVYQEPVYQEPVYQEPVYQEPVTQPVYQVPNDTPAADPEKEAAAKSLLISGILAVAFCAGAYFTGIVALIMGAVGLGKAKKFAAAYGNFTPKARVGKYLSLAGLIGGIVLTVVGLIVLMAACVAAVSGAFN